jgi:hypothetical protein
MPEFYFPVLHLVPGFDGDDLCQPPFRFVKRKWQTTTFDLATLATRHTLRFPYQLMDVFLGWCNGELAVTAPYLPDAMSLFRSIRLMLYLEGVMPFVCPFTANYSINDYSGINSRDSEMLRGKLPEGLREGLTSDKATVHAAAFEPLLESSYLSDSRVVSEKNFNAVVRNVAPWRALVDRHPAIRNIEGVVTYAPQIQSYEQSLLHLWCGLESLFPSVTSELAFKLALYLSQLVESGPKRRAYFAKVKRSYGNRCKVSHGSVSEITRDDWMETWQIVLDACRAVLRKGTVPAEDALLADILGGE